MCMDLEKNGNSLYATVYKILRCSTGQAVRLQHDRQTHRNRSITLAIAPSHLLCCCFSCLAGVPRCCHLNNLQNPVTAYLCRWLSRFCFR